MHVGNEMTRPTKPATVSGLEPATTLIELIGGPKVAADVCKLKRLQVWRWTVPKNKGGTGGTVPQRHHAAIIRHVREQGIELPLNLLVPGVDEETVVS